MKRLQTLYGKLCAHTDQPNKREARLGWASALVMRPIASFKDLTRDDARHLIDTLQGQLGIPETQPRRRQRLGRDAARKAGTEGRRGYESKEITMAGPAEIARIQHVMDLIGWDQAQLESWLHSPHSPLRNKAAGQIRSLADANRVWWALKGMAVAQGKWQDRRQS